METHDAAIKRAVSIVKYLKDELNDAELAEAIAPALISKTFITTITGVRHLHLSPYENLSV